MNRVRVLFFAGVRDKAGTRTTEIDLEPTATVGDLKAALSARLPAVAEILAHCLAAVNHEYTADETEIPENAEVAFFPPVSGGS